MSLHYARVIKSLATAPLGPDGTAAKETPRVLGRRVAYAVLDAREQSEHILREAHASADRMLSEARSSVSQLAAEVARKARETEAARVAALYLALRAHDERRLERDTERVVELARLLAERLVGESLRIEPERIATLAAEALAQARGARRVRLEACPDDVPALGELLEAIAPIVAEIEANPELGRGSLVLHTELGEVDGRLSPQLERLAAALRQALEESGAR